MKRILIILVVLLAAAGAAIYFTHRGGATAGGGKQLYTCGMHPQVIKDKPGDCPICGMKLQPIRMKPGGSATAGGSATVPGDRKVKFYKSTMLLGEISEMPRKDSMGMDMVPVYEDEDDSRAISIDAVTTQKMGLRTGVVTKGPLRRVIRTVGVIDFDETALSDVTTKFKGWIEKLYVDSTGRQVHKGEPLFEIYSPDLYVAQSEYLLAAKGGAGSKDDARTKLKYWDVSDQQIAELDRNGKPRKTLSVLAPRDGIVVEKMAVEGQMIDAGMKLYRVADLSTVWVQSQIYEQDLAFIKLGQESVVSLSYLPDRKFRGRVTYIYPTVDERTRTAKVRMEFHNPGYFLKPGMFATVKIESELQPEALLVPDSAVLRSGDTNTVFVALDGGKFDPRVVTLGARSENDAYEVLDGLKEGERVVTSGQFMLDSESQLREAIQKMLRPDSDAASAEHAGHDGGAAPKEADARAGHDAASQMSTFPADAGPTAYICPMPEHVSIKYDHAGKCPLCGMTLVPAAAATLGKVQPGGKVAYYTCAMTDACPKPGHDSIKYDKPGKCSVCGMTLIPIMEAPPSKLYTCPMAIHADVVSDKPGICSKCNMKLVDVDTVPHGKTARENWIEKHPATTPAPAKPMTPATPAPAPELQH